MLEKTEIIKPDEIEKRSFEIIMSKLEGRNIPPDRLDIVSRVIHTTADFDYADNLIFSDDAVLKGIDALRSGARIVTDTNMALAGISKRSLEKTGSDAVCFMADEDVALKAKERGITRAAVAIEKAAEHGGRLIFAIGNAPTALISLYDLIKENKVRPELIIGVPVGFVNVCESKEMIMDCGVPYIVARGNKGGSTVAAAVCNALLYRIFR